jgi:large subunit ribosomal protein L10e
LIGLKGRNYRAIKGRPYTRVEYIKGHPQLKIAKFTIGNPNGKYDYVFKLISCERAQIRHNALEAARVSVNKLATALGEGNYYLSVKAFPHCILRENKVVATAGADRLSEGMRRAFGKAVGLAARVEVGSVLLELGIKGKNVQQAKDAIKVASSKLPVKTRLEIVESPAEAPGA